MVNNTMRLLITALSIFTCIFQVEKANPTERNMTINSVNKIILLPDGKTVEATIINKNEIPPAKANLPKHHIELEDYEVFGHGEDVFLWDGKCIVDLNDSLFLSFQGIADYIKVILGDQHFNALSILFKDSSLYISYAMFDFAITNHLEKKKYIIDSISYPSKGTTSNGGYKAYLFEDGSVGYFYLFNPQLGRYMGWWHENIQTFEWFYNKVYELTGIFPN